MFQLWKNRILKKMQVELDKSKVDSLLLPLLHEKVIRSLPAKTVIKKRKPFTGKVGEWYS